MTLLPPYTLITRNGRKLALLPLYYIIYLFQFHSLFQNIKHNLRVLMPTFYLFAISFCFSCRLFSFFVILDQGKSYSIPIMEEEDDSDWISKLPHDILLIRILNLLPCQEVFRAKLLSKAWQKTSEICFEFRSVPPLSFEQPLLDDNVTISSFIDSINSSLKLHCRKNLPLSKLRLRLDHDLIRW